MQQDKNLWVKMFKKNNNKKQWKNVTAYIFKIYP